MPANVNPPMTGLCAVLSSYVASLGLRAASGTDDEGPKKKRQGEPAPASEWTLIFDTETTVDAAQRLRIGAYQFRNRDGLDEGGLTTPKSNTATVKPPMNLI
jgi:hypothetical protein